MPWGFEGGLTRNKVSNKDQASRPQPMKSGWFCLMALCDFMKYVDM